MRRVWQACTAHKNFANADDPRLFSGSVGARPPKLVECFKQEVHRVSSVDSMRKFL